MAKRRRTGIKMAKIRQTGITMAKRRQTGIKIAPPSHIAHITFFFVQIFWNRMYTSPQEISPVYHFKGDI
jgi:hypothetical protein